MCPNDPCGGRCVNSKRHPNSCGACGNKCASGYCFEGQCFTPSADKCALVQGFGNSSSSSSGTPVVSSNDFASGQAFVKINDGTWSFWIRNPKSAEVTTTLKMCAGSAYELSYSIAPIITGSPDCTFKFRVANGEWSSGESIKGRSGGSSPPAKDPYIVSTFQVRDAGTTPDGLSLSVPFTARLECSSTPSIPMLVGEFALVPKQ